MGIRSQKMTGEPGSRMRPSSPVLPLAPELPDSLAPRLAPGLFWEVELLKANAAYEARDFGWQILRSQRMIVQKTSDINIIFSDTTCDS